MVSHESQAVGDVGGRTATTVLQLVNQNGEREDVQFVRLDQVFVTTLKVHNPVDTDTAGEDNGTWFDHGTIVLN